MSPGKTDYALTSPSNLCEGLRRPSESGGGSAGGEPGACTLGQPSHSPGFHSWKENQVQPFAERLKEQNGNTF